MALDAQTELNAVEAAYLAWLQAGCPQSYTISGRSVTRSDMFKLTQRMDQLRAVIYRQNNGMFQAAQNRNPE